MERTLRGEDEPPAEAGQPVNTGRGWDLMDAAFIDEFDEQEGLVRVTYDSVRATPSIAVLAVVSNLTGTDALKLDPLNESVDSEALDAMFLRDTPSNTHLTFQYSGCEITVGSENVVEVVAR